MQSVRLEMFSFYTVTGLRLDFFFFWTQHLINLAAVHDSVTAQVYLYMPVKSRRHTALRNKTQKEQQTLNADNQIGIKQKLV